MKLKLDANGNVVVKDGMPVYVHDDGTEHPFDAKATVGKITQLNGEAQANRVRAEKAEDSLKAFAGIEDPVAAKKALDTVKNLDDKKLVDAGEVDKVKNAAMESVRKEYEPIVKERDTLQQQLVAEKIGGSFARSPLISGKDRKLAIPADMAQAFFGKHFSIDKDGKIVAKDANGKEIFSKSRHGEFATFDEALEQLVDAYPQKDSILLGSGASGGGAGNGKGAGGGNGTKIDPNLSPIARLDAARGAAQT